MKKILLAIMIFIFLIAMILPLNKTVAVENTKDQSYEEISGTQWTTEIKGKSFSQVFKPTVNRITSVGFYIDGARTSTIGYGDLDFNIYALDGGQLETPDKGPLFDGRGYHASDESGPRWTGAALRPSFAIVTPGKSYKLEIQQDSISVEGSYKLGYNSVNNYQGGYFTEIPNSDLLFRVYGYNETFSNPPSEGNTQQPTKKPNTVAPNPVEQSVQKPTLSYILKNEQQINAPISEEIEISSKDSLKVAGTSLAGADVALFIGDKAYFSPVGNDGKWEISVEADNIKEGSYTAQAQTQTKEGKGSEVVDFFKLKKIDQGTEEVKAPEPHKLSFLAELFYGKYYLYTTIALLAALVFLIRLKIWK